MFIKIQQTQSKLKNTFEIYYGDVLKYFAGTPWMKLSMPFDLQNKRDNVMTDISGNIEFTSHWIDKIPFEIYAKRISNIAKVFTGGVQVGAITEIYDKERISSGRFYHTTLKLGIGDNKDNIEWGDERITGYSKDSGRSHHVSLYIGDIQIGQLVKPLSVINNLDVYYLFLLDEYNRFAKVLSFFAIYYDRQHYNRAGEIAIYKKEYHIAYSFDRNDKYYQPSWIRNNFDLEKIAPEYIPFDVINKKYDTSKTYFKFLGLLFGFFILVFVILFIIFSYMKWLGLDVFDENSIIARLIITVLAVSSGIVFICAVVFGIKMQRKNI